MSDRRRARHDDARADNALLAKTAADESFPVASLLLSRSVRVQVLAFYRVARRADDIADAPDLAPAEKHRRLDAIDAALDPQDPATPWLRQLLRAFRQDVDQSRYDDWPALVDYCRLSAVPVGRFLLGLHGAGPEADAPADALCIALQVLNHLQDCAEDYRLLGRIYLPGVTGEDLTVATTPPALRRVFDRLLDRVAALLAEAQSLPGLIRDRRLRGQAAATVAMARRHLQRLRREDPLAGGGRIGRWEAIVAGSAGLRAAFLPAGGGGSARGSSFYWAMRLLPPDRRRAIYAVYEFCRVVDDIADGEDAPADKQAALEVWRQEIAAVFAGRPTMPLGRSLADAARGFPIRQDDCLAVIDGMAMDAGDPIRAPDWPMLELYCDRVAGAVGRLSVAIFGAEGDDAAIVAARLGQALQLTNILRDLDEDAARGRLYLPREALAAHGIPDNDPETALSHPALPLACAMVAAVARDHYSNATAALARLPARPMRPARLMQAVYARVLDRLEQRGWRQPAERLRLPRAELLWLVLRHGLFAR